MMGYLAVVFGIMFGLFYLVSLAAIEALFRRKYGEPNEP